MNTILTDDEVEEVQSLIRGDHADVRTVEAAVLAKLREQQPVLTIRTWTKPDARTGEPRRHYEEVAVGNGIDKLPDGEHRLYAAPEAPAVVPQEDRVKTASELIRLADIHRDCGRLVSKDGTAERVMRQAAAMLAAAPEAPAPDGHDWSANVIRTAKGWMDRALRAEKKFERARRWAIAAGVPPEKLDTTPEAPAHAGKQSAVDEFNRVIQHAITLRLEAFQFLNCWNEGDWGGCREFGFEPNLPYKIQAPALPAVVQVPQAFADWLCREMPPGTVISDPAWWAPRIARAMLAAAPEAPAQEHYEKLEREHLGDPDKRTGIYAAPEAPAQGERAMQYYYRTNKCTAATANDAKCTCWHDEGFGPFPDARHNAPHEFISNWRQKAKAPALPAEVREAIKVARGALGSIKDGGYRDIDGDWVQRVEADLNKVSAAIARLDALGGVE